MGLPELPTAQPACFRISTEAKCLATLRTGRRRLADRLWLVPPRRARPLPIPPGTAAPAGTPAGSKAQPRVAPSARAPPSRFAPSPAGPAADR
jgi:hypothetical protein